jgi:hypothetical protein
MALFEAATRPLHHETAEELDDEISRVRLESKQTAPPYRSISNLTTFSPGTHSAASSDKKYPP